MKYDVVVVGSGPSGSVTARFAAESGAKVLIIERRREVGVPVLCAEGISKKVDDYNLLKGKQWMAASIDGARIFSPNGTMVKLSADLAGAETGYVLNREFFDKELARGAVNAGAKLMLNTCAIGLIKKEGGIKGVKVKQFNDEFDIYADIVVGADGVESRVGRWAGINTTLKPYDLETCAQYTLTNVEFEDGYCDFYLGKKIAPGGYVWVFPKGKDVANVGIGISASLSKPGEAKRLLDEFIASHPELNKGEPLRFLAGAVPVARPVEATKDSLLLVGDAARQTDPITGGGLMASIEAGKTAGEVIGEAVETQRFDKETLSTYEEKLKQTLYKKFERNYIVKETLLDFDDKTLNMLADSLKDYDFEGLSTLSLIKALVAKHPTLLMRLRPLLKAR